MTRTPHLDNPHRSGPRATGARLPAAALACSLAFLSCLAAGTPSPAAAQDDRDSHHWIVLLDVSASFEQRDQAQHGREGYRLRNEALSLLHTLLAARRIKEQERRDDRLSVYVFGQGVSRVQELTTRPVVWTDINDPDWWEKQIPGGLSARTNYFEALRLAVDAFKIDPPETRQHLVLISDGELDVGEENRLPGAPPGREEIAVYRNLLRQDTAPLNWLHDRGVQVHTLAIDESLAGYNDEERQKQIRSTLYDYQIGGATPLERARGLLESQSGKVGEGGKLVEGEGPYVMAALAYAFNGKSRSVRHDNILNVLWETLFPEQTSRRVLPLGTKKVIVFAPRQSPVTVRVGDPGQHEELSLIYDEKRDSYRVDPPGRWDDLQVNVRATSQYATWMITHPKLVQVDPEHQLAEDSRFSIVPVINVDLRWEAGRPPEEALGDIPVPLTLDLAWHGEPPEPTRDEWRRYLEQALLTATGEVEAPDATTTPITFRTSIPRDASDLVLRIESEFKARLEGDHDVRASLTIGDAPESPQLKVEPARFNILLESPLSVEGRFALHLRPWRRGEAGEGVAFPPRSAGGDRPRVLRIDSGEEQPTVFFEWRGAPGEDCKGVERLRLRLPSPVDRTFGRDENEVLAEERPLEADGPVCYRSPGLLVEPGMWDKPLVVEAGDGLETLTWRWQLERPTPPGTVALYTVPPLLLLLAALVAYLRRDAIKRWWARRQAPFPLAVDLPDGTLEWSGQGPKRFVIALDSKDEPRGEVSRRKPAANEKAVVVEPERKHSYSVRVASGPAWNLFRLDDQGRTIVSRPLSKTGDTVSLLDLSRGQRLRLEHGDAVVTLRHRNR